MAFVNEYISEEEKNQYRLDALWERYSSDVKIKILNTSGPAEWAIDIQRESWLIYFAKVKDKGFEYRRQFFTKEHIFIFYFEGIEHEVRLMRER